MKKLARWLYMKMYNKELVDIAKFIRNDNKLYSEKIVMIYVLEKLDLLK